MFFDFSQFEVVFQIILAVFLGGLVGLEREKKRKEAGLRTFALVCLGACFFTLASMHLANDFVTQNIVFSSSTVIQAVAIGIGFLGSGLIVHKKGQIEGLTTAAGLWTTAAIGIGIGLKLYFLSMATVLLMIVIFTLFQLIEEKVLPFKKRRNHA